MSISNSVQMIKRIFSAYNVSRWVSWAWDSGKAPWRCTLARPWKKVGEKYRERKAGIICQDEQYSQGAETHGVGGGEHMRGIRSKWGRRTDAEELVVLCGMWTQEVGNKPGRWIEPWQWGARKWGASVKELDFILGAESWERQILQSRRQRG